MKIIGFYKNVLLSPFSNLTNQRGRLEKTIGTNKNKQKQKQKSDKYEPFKIQDSVIPTNKSESA